MIAILEKDVNLGFFFSRNNLPLIGQTVTVRVINQTDGSELLPSTPCPETGEPGYYNFIWTDSNPNPPPVITTQMLVFFDSRSQVFSRSLDLIEKANVISDISAEVFDSDILTAQVFDSDEFTAEIPDQDLTASLEEADDLGATVEDDTLKGSVEC